MVVDDRPGLTMTAYGRPFYKLTGSGNDFVFVDARAEPPGRLLPEGMRPRIPPRALAARPSSFRKSRYVWSPDVCVRLPARAIGSVLGAASVTPRPWSTVR